MGATRIGAAWSKAVLTPDYCPTLSPTTSTQIIDRPRWWWSIAWQEIRRARRCAQKRESSRWVGEPVTAFRSANSADHETSPKRQRTSEDWRRSGGRRRLDASRTSTWLRRRSGVRPLVTSERLAGDWARTRAARRRLTLPRHIAGLAANVRCAW